jgi:hypothetical protein
VADRGPPFTERRSVIERLTRSDDATILYDYTVEDPAVYTGSWGGQVPFRKLDDLVYEYSCHEGNYALEGVLRGARFEESTETAAPPRQD